MHEGRLYSLLYLGMCGLFCNERELKRNNRICLFSDEKMHFSLVAGRTGKGLDAARTKLSEICPEVCPEAGTC